jgi:hypothetical protein
MTPTCINLRERFGDRYRVTFEESYQAETIDKHAEAPWLMVIPCEHGEIFPHGRDKLAAYTSGPQIRKRLMSLACCQVHQLGDSEVTVLFDVADFYRVAEIMKPRKKRKAPPMSEERKRLFAALGRQNLARINAEKVTFQSGKSGQISTILGQVD